jgi:hypothetical protein
VDVGRLPLLIQDLQKAPVVYVEPFVTVKAGACSTQRGGQSSAAAMDFAKGAKDITLSQYGITVSVSSADSNTYKLSLTKT